MATKEPTELNFKDLPFLTLIGGFLLLVITSTMIFSDNWQSFFPSRTPEIYEEAPSSYPVEQICTNGGGTWSGFPDGCADSCQKARDPFGTMCTAVMTSGCDCGPEFCWDKETQACENNLAENLPDLDVLYIERLPRYDFDASKKWPGSGEVVTFKAHIKNNGNGPTGSFSLKWTVDGQIVSLGTSESLDPGEETTTPYSWPWGHALSSDKRIQGSHSVEFVVDFEDEIGEISENNNGIKDLTQSLAVGLWVEQSVYDFFNQNQYQYCQDKVCAGSNSWEDWAQRQIREWNKLFENSHYSSAPDGVLDRVRLDKILVVPDCTLPLNGGIADNHPDKNDKTVDLMWGFTSAKVGVIACPRDEADGNKNLYFNYPEHQNIEWPLMHELSHARYLVDTWGFNVKGEGVLVRDDGGSLIAGTSLLPYIQWDIVYLNKDQKIMGAGDSDTGYGEHSTGALNRVRGFRARKGNYNSPAVIGEYLNDLPFENKFQFLNKIGEPLNEAKISVYQASSKNEWYGKVFDNVVDIEKITDQNGTIVLPRNPFGGLQVVHNYGSANGILLFKIEYQDQVSYRFQEVSDLNLAYWSGQIETVTFEIATEMEPGTPIPTPTPEAGVIDIIVRFAGVTSRPTNDADQTVKVWGESLDGSIVLAAKALPLSITFSVNDQGLYIGTLNLTSVQLDKHYRLVIKGPRHLGREFVDVVLSEGGLDLTTSGELLPGDLNQDGLVNSVDVGIVNENTGPNVNPNGDLNYDNYTKAADKVLILDTLSVRYDPE